MHQRINLRKHSRKKENGHKAIWKELGTESILKPSKSDKDEVRLLKNKIHKDPQNHELYNTIGVHFIIMRSFEDAEKFLRTGIKMNRRVSSLWSNLAMSLDKQGRLDEAKTALKMAISLSPYPFRYYNNMAILLFAEGNYSEGVSMLLDSIENGRAKPRVRLNLAIGYHHLTLREKAKEQLELVIKQSEESGDSSLKERAEKLLRHCM